MIAKRVAHTLGFNIVDRNLIGEEADRLGINRNEAVGCDITEDNYEFRSQLLGGDDRQLFCLLEPSPSRIQKSQPISESSCISLEKQIIKAIARRGQVVIIGRGSQALLSDQPNVLHFKIVAPHFARVLNVQSELGLAMGEADNMIWERDWATEQYLKRFHNLDWQDESYYDMILDTGVVSVPVAAKWIMEMAINQSSRSITPRRTTFADLG